MPVPPQVHVAAASDRVAARLGGPVRPAELLATGRDALYLRDDDVVLAVLSRRATAVPCGLRTTLGRVPDAGPVLLGDGRCRMGDDTVEVTRRIDVRVPPLRLSRVAEPWDRHPALRTAREEVDGDGAALALLAAGDAACVPALLGRGSGLTPTGDDIVAGWLAAARSAGRTVAPVLDAVRRSARSSTTALSAGLLECACRGEAIPEVRRLLRALHADHGVPTALEALVAVGHTSGAAMALGVHLALDPLDPTETVDRRHHR